MVVLSALGLLATIVFAAVWGIMLYVVATNPPDVDETTLLYVYGVLTCGVIVIGRSLLLGL